MPTRLAGKILQALVNARLLAESQQAETAYLPARPLEQISCHDVLHALRTSRSGSVATRDDALREKVRGQMEHFQEAERAATANVTRDFTKLEFRGEIRTPLQQSISEKFRATGFEFKHQISEVV